MKNSKFYVIGSVFLVMATVVLLFVAVYVVPSLAPPLLPHPAQAAERNDSLTGDPLISVSYRLEVEGQLSGFFTEVSGIGSENEIVEHIVADEQGNRIVRKIPGRLEWTNVVLKRGITSDMQLWEWRKAVEDSNMMDMRKNVSVIMMDQGFQDVARWDFTNAWPCRITGPAVVSDSNKLSVEEIEIVSEGMVRVN
ncbi:MAG TPA: phage tail protein [Dehalococcoidales bacterium]|nr:phage tail protein [Dehalococcoidales bacterium]